MPVGVPKVPFLLNEQKGSDWVDLYNYMYHQGILFLCHELDDELTNQLIGSMLFLEHKNRTRAIQEGESYGK